MHRCQKQYFLPTPIYDFNYFECTIVFIWFIQYLGDAKIGRSHAGFTVCLTITSLLLFFFSRPTCDLVVSPNFSPIINCSARTYQWLPSVGDPVCRSSIHKNTWVITFNELRLAVQLCFQKSQVGFSTCYWTPQLSLVQPLWDNNEASMEFPAPMYFRSKECLVITDTVLMPESLKSKINNLF